jgi:hypothetical protein
MGKILLNFFWRYFISEVLGVGDYGDDWFVGKRKNYQEVAKYFYYLARKANNWGFQ